MSTQEGTYTALKQLNFIKLKFLKSSIGKLTDIFVYLNKISSISGQGQNPRCTGLINTSCDRLLLYRTNFCEGPLAGFPRHYKESHPNN